MPVGLAAPVQDVYLQKEASVFGDALIFVLYVLGIHRLRPT